MTKAKAPQSTKAREATKSKAQAKTASARTTKIDQLVAMLNRPDGATIAEMCDLTGWQSHSVRGALAGSLRRKGFEVTSDAAEGTRRYRIGATG